MSRSAASVLHQASRRLLIAAWARATVTEGGRGGGVVGRAPSFASSSSASLGHRLLPGWPRSPQHDHHRWLSTSASSSSPSPPPKNDADANANTANDHPQRQQTFAPLYKGKWILPVRLLVRAKIFQLAGFGSVALAASMIAAGDLTPTDAALLAALTTGCVGSAFSLWYYSSRYVGELSVLLPPDKNKLTLRLSSLDFWGNRADVSVDARRLLPVVKSGGRTRGAEVERLTSQILFPVNVVPRVEAVIGGGDCDQEEEDGEDGDGRDRRRTTTAMAATATPPLPAGERRQFYLSAVAGASSHPRLLMALLDGSLVAARPWQCARPPRTAEELERAVLGGTGDDDEGAAASARARGDT
jgi:hypothetical protein